ncbi:HAD-IG family 5'-nucleotidase [Vulgatibacter sp.]|uniref:HAD-IG family 5'-nucleotidase n=1 Tax=Vulgatibacter sp. TaxID=1971226 RepID=UPI003569EE50
MAHPQIRTGDAATVSLDPELLRLLERPNESQVPTTRRIYVNRNLRMDQIDLIGFDMDYTLAIYHMRRIEQLSFDMTLALLVRQFGYPQVVESIRYDHQFVMRGLVVDKEQGNLLKMDRFNHVGRVYHGRQLLDREAWRRLYRDEKIRLSSPRYAWIDTLFALPEASMYAEVIELLEGRGERVDYGKLYDDIREAIDTVHRDGSLKTEITKDLPAYVFRDPELGPALHKLRSGGKKLFVLTNSLFDYTDAVMSHLLDGQLPEYPSWRNYFDLVVVGGSKPRFFTERHPFVELDESGAVQAEAQSLERGKIYQGGNLVDLERMAGFGGERVLYVGDHIYGDILKSKKTSLWRTCMIVEELEEELAHMEASADQMRHLAEAERLRARLEDELGLQKARLNALDRKLERGDVEGRSPAELEAMRQEAKRDLERVRRAVREIDGMVGHLAESLESGFNRYWGLIFKEGNENSRFGEQVEDYACLYTSRVSNFLFSSPMQYFRSPREVMPHEVGFEALSPFGGDSRRPGDRMADRGG